MALNAAGLNLAANALREGIKFAQIHSGRPGVNGTANRIATPRHPILWVAPDGGDFNLILPLQFDGMAPGQRVSHISLWSAAGSGELPAGGTHYGNVELTGDSFADQYGRFTVDAINFDSISTNVVALYRGTAAQPETRTTYTFENLPFGPESEDRIVVVGFCGNYSDDAQVFPSMSVTINGEAPAGGAAGVGQGVLIILPSPAFVYSGLWYRRIPAGLTGTAAVTFNKPAQACRASVWTVHGADPDTPMAYANGTGLSSGLFSGNQAGSLALPGVKGGAFISQAMYGAEHLPGGQTTDMWWSANVEEDFDAQWPNAIHRAGGGHGEVKAALTGVSAAVGTTSAMLSVDRGCIAALVFGPQV